MRRDSLTAGLAGVMAVTAVSGCSWQSDATLRRFEQLLAHEDSATAALTHWCRVRGLAEDPVITAVRLGQEPSDPPADARALLAVHAGEPLAFRRVRLNCGDLVLSEARNWYLPSRLPPAMVRELERGNRPFGGVIAPLGFHRERLDSRRGGIPGCPRRTILSNRAVIRAGDGRALALVLECYQPGVLAPPGG